MLLLTVAIRVNSPFQFRGCRSISFALLVDYRSHAPARERPERRRREKSETSDLVNRSRISQFRFSKKKDNNNEKKKECWGLRLGKDGIRQEEEMILCWRDRHTRAVDVVKNDRSRREGRGGHGKEKRAAVAGILAAAVDAASIRCTTTSRQRARSATPAVQCTK